MEPTTPTPKAIPKTGSKARKPRLKLPKDGKNKPELPKNSTLTEEKLSVFITAIENNLLLQDALDEAQISHQAYRRLLKRSGTFRERLRLAERKMHILVKSKIGNAINAGDMPTVRWWAERKIPEEFRPAFGEGDIQVIGNITTVIVPMGNKPHPRILPDPKDAK
tara:strand:+ start:4184 stop:4678 length:495 start_codon:yes stop_codon:yes gene_type:complete